MRLLLLGDSSVSGRGFLKTVRKHHPAAEIINLSRAELGAHPPYSSSVIALKEKIGPILRRAAPSHIVNFLGSFSNEFSTDLLANVVIPQALLDAVIDASSRASILLIGSAAEYGRIENPNLPVRESAPLAPVTVYGLTKSMQSLLVPFYAQRFSVNVKLARTFNLLAPNLSQKLFIGRVFHQIEEIKVGKRTSIAVGSLDEERDYISVDDATTDYLQILQHGKAGEAYNVCSGSATKMRDILNIMLAEAGLSSVEIHEEADLSRPGVPKIFGSREKLDSLRVGD
jgi:nucleoside-diphosphate-sugar epimerase